MNTAPESSKIDARRVLAMLEFDTGLSAERLATMRFVRLDEVGGDLRLLESGADARDWCEFGLSPDTVAALAVLSWRQVVGAAQA